MILLSFIKKLFITVVNEKCKMFEIDDLWIVVYKDIIGEYSIHSFNEEELAWDKYFGNDVNIYYSQYKNKNIDSMEYQKKNGWSYYRGSVYISIFPISELNRIKPMLDNVFKNHLWGGDLKKLNRDFQLNKILKL